MNCMIFIDLVTWALRQLLFIFSWAFVELLSASIELLDIAKLLVDRYRLGLCVGVQTLRIV